VPVTAAGLGSYCDGIEAATTALKGGG
jgi:hypothetical protein